MQPITGQWYGLVVMCVRVLGDAGAPDWVATCVRDGGELAGVVVLTPVTDVVDIVIVEHVCSL